MKRIGLFFGSFNPIHIGHLIIAQYIQQNTSLDEVWMVVSPHNPFKKKRNLLDERSRLHLVQLAVEDIEGLQASDVEFYLEKPSYTVVTLAHLREKYPDQEFHLIMGSDNRENLHRWRNGDYIEEHFPIIVYPRPNHPKEKDHPNTLWIDAPLMELSSTYIRHSIKEGRNASFMLDAKVWKYIDHNNLYK